MDGRRIRFLGSCFAALLGACTLATLHGVPALQQRDLARIRDVHKRLYHEFAHRLPAGEGQKTEVYYPLPLQAWPQNDSAEGYFHELVCHADAAVVGVISSAQSNLTDDRSLVFTDYEVEVSEVIVDKPGGLSNGQVIVVSRPGGRVSVPGRQLVAKLDAFKQLEEGSTYLLFLNSTPAGEYQTRLSGGGFLVTGDRLVLQSRQFLPASVASLSLREAIAAILAAAQSACR